MRVRVLINALLLMLCVNLIHAQDTCESDESLIDDLNVITKCNIDNTEETSASGKKTKKLSVKVSTSTRYMKKRTNKSAVGMNSAGVESLKTGSIGNKLNLSAVSNVEKLKEKLSAERLKNSFEFEDVDVVPLFGKCKLLKSNEANSCFQEQMMLHIQKNLKYPHEAVLKKIQGNVWVRFVIDDEGNVTNLKTLSPKKQVLLTQEAERVIAKLPIFTPAKRKGKNVMVKYGFPINFSLEN